MDHEDWKGYLSLVIPLFNEEKNLLPLYTRLKEALKEYRGSYEIIFVDDGSTDHSYDILEELSKKDETTKVIQLRGNQGKSSALEIGFQQAQGEIVITLDADLQADPVDIPLFLEKLEEGFDLVSGWRNERRDDYWKIFSSFLFNKITAFITGVNLHDFNCGYKAYRRDVLNQIELLPDFHRFIPVLAALQGYSVGEIKVHHHPRFEGHSKYGLARYPAGFFNLITIIFLRKYATKP
ncbi:MAG: glycosyltransferase family 2 protein, partial [Candidatus Tectomicrobia bacterium]|nr:glycosyltransferase family 2 protein [Candidatus Tectomicrobia bacterium]